MPTTAAIAAGVGAAGSIGGALIQSSAAKTASGQQVALGQQALDQQLALYQQGVNKQTGYIGSATNALQPYISAGDSVLPVLQSLLTPGASQTNVLSQIPGFQFGSQYGTMAATNALAARGQGGSAGPIAAAVSQYNNGLAQSTYGSIVNMLQGYAGMGAGAAGTLGGILGGAGNVDVNGAIGAGNTASNIVQNIGSSTASGTLGSANALATGLTGASGSASNALLLSQILGGGGGGNGLYTPQQIANIGNMQAGDATDAQAAAYGRAMGFS